MKREQLQIRRENKEDLSLFFREGKEGYQGIHSIGYIHKTVEISKSTWLSTSNMGDQNTILQKLAAKELTKGAIPASNNGQR